MFFFPQQALCWHTLVAFLKGCCYKDRQNFNNNVKQRDLKRNQKKSGRRKGWYSVWSSYRAVRDLRYLRETAAFYSLYSNGNLLCSKDGGTQTCLVHFTVKLHPHYKCLCFGFGFWFLCWFFFSSWNMLAHHKIFSGKQHRWLLSQQSLMGTYCIAE